MTCDGCCIAERCTWGDGPGHHRPIVCPTPTPAGHPVISLLRKAVGRPA